MSNGTGSVAKATAHPAPVASTPGPWVVWKSQARANASVNISQAGTNAFVCVVGKSTAPNVMEDARLIAAAPDLLAMLKQARECIAYCRRNHKDPQSGEGFPIEMLIDAVISEAEGLADERGTGAQAASAGATNPTQES